MYMYIYIYIYIYIYMVLEPLVVEVEVEHVPHAGVHALDADPVRRGPRSFAT